MSCSQSLYSVSNDYDEKKSGYNKMTSYTTKNSTLERNKQPIWNVDYKNITIPIIGIAINIPDTIKDSTIHSSFTSSNFEISENTPLINLFSSRGPLMSSQNFCHDINTQQLSSVEDSFVKILHEYSLNIHDYAIQTPYRFVLDISSDNLLLKNSSDGNSCISFVYNRKKNLLNYSSNCDTLSNSLSSEQLFDVDTFRQGIRKYWIPMYNLLDNLTNTWSMAGKRHATLQRIRTIETMFKEFSHVNDKFGKTIRWIIKVLGPITKSFLSLSMNERIYHVIHALADSSYGYLHNNSRDSIYEEDVICFQYNQMNDTILILMTKRVSRSEMRSLIEQLI